MAKKLYKHKTHDQLDPYLDDTGFTTAIPADARAWLYKYGVTDREIARERIAFNPSKSVLVLPVYDGERLVLTNSRYFGDNPDHPKYVTKGYKNQHFKLFPCPGSRTVVLTEDYVSALRIGRQHNAIPLLGTSVPMELVLRLLGRFEPVLVWLDPDKRREALQLSHRISQYVASRAILSDKDPKDYTDDEIGRYLQSPAGQQRVLPADEDSLPRPAEGG